MMINSNKVEKFINNIIEDYENGYCPLHFKGPGCENPEPYDDNWAYCKNCMMAWISTN